MVASLVAMRVAAEAVGLEPTIRIGRTPVFGTGPSSGRMTSVETEISFPSCGGWNRTSGLQVQSLASRTNSNCPAACLFSY